MEKLRFKDHRTILLLMGMLMALGPLSIDMYLPAFGQISSDFGQSISKVEMSLASFFVGLSLGQLIYGPISDRFGRKKPLYVGLIIYALAAIGCGLSSSIEMLITLRFLQALGGCAGMVISRAMVRDLFNHRDSAKVFSMLMLVMGIAPILAPLAGGQLIYHFHWQSIFWLSSFLSLVCLLIVATKMPETGRSNPDAKISKTFATYIEILKDRDFLRNALAGGILQAGMFAYITGSSFVFINLFGVKPENFGWIFGMNAGGFILVSQFNSIFVEKYGPKVVLELSLKISFLAAIGLFAAVKLDGSFLVVASAIFVFMSSMGMVLPNSTAGALAGQGARAGAASGLLGTLQFVFATFSSTILSMSHADSALPMASIIGVSGLISILCYRFLAPSSEVSIDLASNT